MGKRLVEVGTVHFGQWARETRYVIPIYHTHLPADLSLNAKLGLATSTPTAWPCVSGTMDVSAEAPLRIGNLRSPKADKPLVAIGIEGSANKVRSPCKQPMFLGLRPWCHTGRPRDGAGDPMLRRRANTDPAPRICFELGNSFSRLGGLSSYAIAAATLRSHITHTACILHNTVVAVALRSTGCKCCCRQRSSGPNFYSIARQGSCKRPPSWGSIILSPGSL